MRRTRDRFRRLLGAGCPLSIALALALSAGCGSSPTRASAPETAQPPADEKGTPTVTRLRHDIVVDNHTLTLWEKSPAHPTGAILLLHGRTWSSLPDFDLQVQGEERSLMDSLAAAGFATFALDQRGYGATERDASGWLSPDRAAADLAEVLRWVKSERGTTPALLGWSYGSLVAQLCVQAHPELVSSLILYGYPRAVNSNYAAGPEKGVEPARKPTTAEAAAEDFIAKGASSPAMVEAFVKAALAADPVRVDWRDRDQFNALDPAKIQVPTLLMQGEHDPYAPVAAQAQVFMAIGNADKRWVILAGGDHAAHLESTGALFVDAVVSFLRRPGAK